MRVALVAALSAVLAGAPAAYGAPGDLDPFFGTGGKALLNQGSDSASAVALQPDGKIVLAGSQGKPGSSDFVVARLTPGGNLDASYGSGSGWSVVDMGGDDFASSVAVEPSGAILVAGPSRISGRFSFAAAQLLSPSGTPDPAFGTGTPGKAFAKFGGSSDDVATALGLTPDGRPLLGGYTNAGGSQDFAVARLKPNGMSDESFGVGTGLSATDLGAGSEDIANALLQQPNGAIVQAGTTFAGAQHDFAVDRITVPDGKLDGSFGSGGKSIVDFGADSFAQAAARQPDGKLVVAGYVQRSGATAIALARLLPSGGLDTSFGGTGRVSVDAGGSEAAQAVAIEGDGKIVVAGSAGGDFEIARLNANGTLDTGFGTGGKVRVDFGHNERALAVAIQPDGRIVVAGDSFDGTTHQMAVARLMGSTGGGGTGAAKLTRLTLKPHAFAAAARGGSATAARRTGATVSYRESRAAITTFTVLRCSKHRHKQCVRFKSVGSFKRKDVAGRNRFHFTGRVRHRKLRPGNYRLRAVPRTGGGAGPAVTTSFRIVR